MKTSDIVSAVFGAMFRICVVIFAVFAIYNGALKAYEYGFRIFTEPAVSSGEGRMITVSVTEDMSPSDIGELFESKGLVKDGTLFMLQYYLSEFQKDVGPGTFELRGRRIPMIIDERMSAFIDAFDKGNPPLLDEIEKYAGETQVPIIRKSMQSLLKFLMELIKPKSILEVGTAIGFSALLMSEYAPRDCRITTIEKYGKRIPIARENFRRAGKEDRITLLEGDAADILKGLEGPYGLIFMDAAKGQYIHFLPDVLRLLSVGGLLVSDNVLQDGDVVESRFAVTRRNRTIHARMRDYIYELKHHPRLETVILPVGDGVTLSVRKP